MRSMNFAMRTAVVVSALTGGVIAQCTVSVRPVLDDYPPVTWGGSEDGLASTVWSQTGEPAKELLVIGGGKWLGPLEPYWFATMMWDGRRCRRLFEVVPPTYGHTWPGIAADPATNTLWTASYNGVHRFDAPRWSIWSGNPLLATNRDLVSSNGSLYLLGGCRFGAPWSVRRLDGGDWTSLPTIPNSLTGDSETSGVFGGCEYGGALVVSTTAGLYTWDGQNWAVFSPALAGFVPRAMTTFQGKLWVADGNFNRPARVRRLNGGVWEEMPAPAAVASAWPKPKDFTVFRGELYLSGEFGGRQTNEFISLLKWDGERWTAPGNGVTGTVTGIGEWQGSVAATGLIRDAYVERQAVLEGDSWTGIGLGTFQISHYLMFQGRRVAAGGFHVTGDHPIDYVAVRDESGWRQLGLALPGPPLAMCEWNGGLAAVVRSAGGRKSLRVLAMSSEEVGWVELAELMHERGDTNSTVVSLCDHGGSLAVGGEFQSVVSVTGALDAQNAAVFDGALWRSAGAQGSLYVSALLSRSDGLHALIRRKYGSAEELVVARWEEGQGWQTVAPTPSVFSRQLFSLGGALGVASQKSFSPSPSSGHLPALLLNGAWCQLPLPGSLLKRVDDRTLAVAGSTARSALQLYRVTFSVDVAGGAGDSGDGVLDGADVARYAEWMGAGDLRADLGSVGGAPVGDDRLDNNDWIVFWQMYFERCR